MTRIDQLTIKHDKAKMDRMLSCWSWRLQRSFSPLFLSLFGDWFLIDENGCIHMLDLIEGEIKLIANSEAEFMDKLKTEEIQKEWLLSQLADTLLKSGIKLAATQCYAFQKPPIVGGEVSIDNIIPWDLEAYQSGTSKLHRKVIDLEPGTEIVFTKPQ